MQGCHNVIKSSQSGVTLCFQFVSAASTAAAFVTSSAAATTFVSHVKTVWAKPLDIWHKEYMSLAKCTGWPYGDLDPRSRLRHQLAKIFLSARWSEHHSSDHYKTWQLHCSSHGYYMIRFWRSSVGNLNFGKFSLKISDVFFQGQTLFWPYRRNGWSDWCETIRKCIGWTLLMHWSYCSLALSHRTVNSDFAVTLYSPSSM